MSDEWEYRDERKLYEYQRWVRSFGESCVVIDRNEKANKGCTGRLWEWWTSNTSWQTFPPSCRTLEQRKAYAVVMARMS